MEREDTLIDLGAAADATRGPIGTLYVDDVLMRNEPGLSDD
jgi:hypothetical protein